MFQLRYAMSELRRRLGRTIVTAVGLAVGVGLVTGIIGVSQGLGDAQNEVLAPLQSVGTDILVTRVVGATSTTAAGTNADTSTTTTTAQQNRGGFFGGGGGNSGDRNSQLNNEDTQALLSENNNVVTDLSKLGKPGETFTRDLFLSATLLSFPQDSVEQISKIDGVKSAVGGLTQLTSHQTGTIPQIVAEVQTGGETIEQNVTPPPMTDEERAKIRACFEANGATAPAAPPSAGGGGADNPGGGGQDIVRRPNSDALAKCVPNGQSFRARFTSPLRTIQQALDPPATDTTSTNYTSAGIDPAHPDQGLVTKAQLTEGRWIATDAPQEVLLSTAYANKNNLKVDSKITVNGTEFTVVGLVNPTLAGNTADVYFSLGKLQELASKQNRVTSVLVKADDAKSVDKVVAEIQKALPGAQVVTTKDLSDQVTGSLADAKKLTDRLGGALGVIVLIAAFVIAMLLTLSSVSKRVREIGTLRAIGWSKARVVRQILIETTGIGLLGGFLGIGIGAAICAAIGVFSPDLTATAQGLAGLSGSQYSQFFGQSADVATTTKQIALQAPLHFTTVLLGLGFALVGGLLAGAVGGWRAARLAPATALRNLG